MATTEEVEFRASDLIGSAGVAGNGEKLVATLDYHYPEALQSALLRRENRDLTNDLDEDDYASVAKLAGVEKVDQVKVRGGERSVDDAWVTYAYIDDKGDVVKGAFPYGDLGSTSSDEHVSQRDSILESPAARDHLAAQEKAAKAAAAGDTSAEAPEPVDPYAALADASAGDLIKQMEEHPERIDAIKAFESATRGDKARKTVLEYEPDTSGDGDGDGQGDGDGSGS